MSDQDVPSPYVGARPFDGTEADQLRFFGRDDEIRKLVALTVAHPALLIYSASGAGKTSLLNAGVLPALKALGFEILPVARFSIPPKRNLLINASQIPNPYIYNLLSWWDEEPATDATLASFLRSYPYSVEKPTAGAEQDSDEPLRIVILDQFEELFTVHPESWEKHADVFRQIDEALDKDRFLHIVIAMREDRIAYLDPFLSSLHDKIDTHYHLQPRGRAAALLAIKKPVERLGFSFDEQVAEQIVEQLLQNRVATGAIKGNLVEPVQLQVVGQRIWQKRDRTSNVITVSDPLASTDVDSALREFYEWTLDKVVKTKSVKEKDVREWFERSLITPLKTRSIVYGVLPAKAIEIFENNHLIRTEERGGVPFYELTHDRFISPILESNQHWRTKRRRSLGARAAVVTAMILFLVMLVILENYASQANANQQLAAVLTQLSSSSSTARCANRLCVTPIDGTINVLVEPKSGTDLVEQVSAGDILVVLDPNQTDARNNLDVPGAWMHISTPNNLLGFVEASKLQIVESRVLGVDVSFAQVNVDWAALRSQGVRFGLAKASDGMQITDNQFLRNWNGMRVNGVLRGAYHYFRALQDSTAQVNQYLSIVQLEANDLPAIVMVESAFNTTATNSQWANGLTNWLQQIEQRTGRTPIIYTRANYWDGLGIPNASRYPLWVANWRSPTSQPILPNDWTNWTFWQYSSPDDQSFTHVGLAANFDLDYFNGSFQDLMTFVQPPVATRSAP